LGLLMAVSGAGAVVGSLLVASVVRTEGNGRVLLGLTVLYGVPIVAVALSRTLWVTLPMLFLAGVLGAAFMSGNNAMIQHRVGDDVRGRVMGAYMLTWGFMPLGSLPMGMVADRVGITTAVAAGAIVSSVLAAVYGLRSSVLRAL
jgi:predicted MFS family arabinose efflux permease